MELEGFALNDARMATDKEHLDNLRLSAFDHQVSPGTVSLERFWYLHDSEDDYWDLQLLSFLQPTMINELHVSRHHIQKIPDEILSRCQKIIFYCLISTSKGVNFFTQYVTELDDPNLLGEIPTIAEKEITEVRYRISDRRRGILTPHIISPPMFQIERLQSFFLDARKRLPSLEMVDYGGVEVVLEEDKVICQNGVLFFSDSKTEASYSGLNPDTIHCQFLYRDKFYFMNVRNLSEYYGVEHHVHYLPSGIKKLDLKKSICLTPLPSSIEIIRFVDSRYPRNLPTNLRELVLKNQIGFPLSELKLLVSGNPFLHLETLVLEQPEITEDLPITLVDKFPNLRTLSLAYGNRIDITDLILPVNLTSFEINPHRESKIDFVYHRQLESLKFSSCQIAYAPIDGCYITSVEISEVDQLQITLMHPNLQHLTIRDSKGLHLKGLQHTLKSIKLINSTLSHQHSDISMESLELNGNPPSREISKSYDLQHLRTISWIEKEAGYHQFSITMDLFRNVKKFFEYGFFEFDQKEISGEAWWLKKLPENFRRIRIKMKTMEKFIDVHRSYEDEGAWRDRKYDTFRREFSKLLPDYGIMKMSWEYIRKEGVGYFFHDLLLQNLRD